MSLNNVLRVVEDNQPGVYYKVYYGDNASVSALAFSSDEICNTLNLSGSATQFTLEMLHDDISLSFDSSEGANGTVYSVSFSGFLSGRSAAKSAILRAMQNSELYFILQDFAQDLRLVIDPELRKGPTLNVKESISGSRKGYAVSFDFQSYHPFAELTDTLTL